MQIDKWTYPFQNIVIVNNVLSVTIHKNTDNK